MVDRVYQRNTSDSAPQPPADPSIGYPTAGNPAQGVPATIPGPYWYHMITESLRRVVVEAGLTPDHEDLGQVVEALQVMGLGGYASEADAQALSSLTKLLTPGRLDDAFKGDNQSISTNGYQILPGGLILQWGASQTPQQITFPIEFPTACLAVFATERGTPSGQIDNGISASPTTTGVEIFQANNTSYVLAIGH